MRETTVTSIVKIKSYRKYSAHECKFNVVIRQIAGGAIADKVDYPDEAQSIRDRRC